MLQSLLLINQEEGISGLYAGIVPRLLAGLGTVILINVAKNAFSRYVFDPSPMTAHISEFVASVNYLFLLSFQLCIYIYILYILYGINMLYLKTIHKLYFMSKQY